MSEGVTVQQIFRRQQEIMLAALRGDRETVPHAPSKGASAESRWVRMLSDHLPRRYSVGSGFVVDHMGKMSQQIDVLIYDVHFSPVFRDGDGVVYIPAEGVYGVFEVKPELRRGALAYAGDKVQSVRQLARTSARIPYAEGVYESKEPFPILGGLITSSCGWRLPFDGKLAETIAGMSTAQKLDLGCALDAGAWRVTSDSTGAGHAEVTCAEDALIAFFLMLLQQLQQVATVPAIEFNKYADTLSLGPPVVT